MKKYPFTTVEENLIKLLRDSPDVISGEKIAQSLGISRVAVWKKIQKLKKENIPIYACKRGYSLSNKMIFFKAELDNMIKNISLFEDYYYFYETSSTMEIAKELAEKGKRVIVIAEKQTQGRGRLGRKWESQEGGLWFTLSLTNSIPLKHVFLLTYLSAVATALAIRDTYQLPAKVKWPNDVLLHERKVAGILLEIKAEVDLLLYTLIGIGVNVNNKVTHKEFLYPAISISEALNKEVQRLPLLSTILSYFEKLYSEKTLILPLWKELSETLGKWIKVVTFGKEVIGQAIDLDEEGALLVKTKEGL